MTTRALDNISSNNVVEMQPEVNIGSPFKGKVTECRDDEVVIRPTEHGLEKDILGINLHIQKDQFSILIKDEGSKNTKVYGLSGLRVYDSNGEIVYADSINEGDIVYDENCPDWSDDARVKVTGISDKRADEYDVDGDTVADYNPDHPCDDTVIEGEYVQGKSKDYAFPISRLSVEDPEEN